MVNILNIIILISFIILIGCFFVSIASSISCILIGLYDGCSIVTFRSALSCRYFGICVDQSVPSWPKTPQLPSHLPQYTPYPSKLKNQLH